jgi:DNA (cytosine-5)-methyltransferase 1
MAMKLNYVSVFSGAGGLDAGLEDAGWTCRYASDLDKHAVATLEMNRGLRLPSRRMALQHAFIEQADIRDLVGSQIAAKAAFRKGDLALLAGGPPCQSWSSAGHQLGLDDPRGQLFRDFVRLASALDVRWLLFENVRGLLTARGPDGEPGSALGLIREELLKAGFQTTVSLLNAADFGVPQRRVRLVIVGYRKGDEPQFPVASHAKSSDLLNSNFSTWRTLGEAIRKIGRLEEIEIIRPKKELARELSKILPGSGVKSPGKVERTRPSGHWGYKQGAFVADLNESARTVTANGQQDWIIDPRLGLRRLCPRECAAIQSFPPGWKLSGGATVQYRLIGNAVPPLLARAVGKALLDHASKESKKSRATSFRRELSPLPRALESAIAYTRREEKSNGASRRSAPAKRSRKIKTENWAG